MQFNSIQFDSIILLHLYTTLFLPSRRHCDLHHKRSTLIDFRCLCHQLLFNIWNPVREHSSCIKTTPQFSSIQFNFTTTPKCVSHCRLRRRRLYGLVSSPRRGPVRFAPGSPSPPPPSPPPSSPSPPGIVNFVFRVAIVAGSGVATGAKVREDTGVAPQCNSLTLRSHRFWLHLWSLT